MILWVTTRRSPSCNVSPEAATALRTSVAISSPACTSGTPSRPVIVTRGGMIPPVHVDGRRIPLPAHERRAEHRDHRPSALHAYAVTAAPVIAGTTCLP